jgi:hypothetical protein
MRRATLLRRLAGTQQNRPICFGLRPSTISSVVCENISSRRAHSLAQVNTQNPKATMRQPTESFGNYNLIKRVKLDFTDVVVSKWKSSVTGLTVIHLDYEGIILLSFLQSLFNAIRAAPVVNGYFVVATESLFMRLSL